MKLVLFDIDGTILWSDGAGRRAMETALLDTFGRPGDPTLRYDGKTDPQIVREAMVGQGIAEEEVQARLPHALARYVELLEREISAGESRPTVFPGIPALLDTLEARDDILLGLLTGNVSEGARIKLGAAGVDTTRFRVAAYGSDHHERGSLPEIAQQRGSDHIGRGIPGERVVIIGDTPADIACGQAIGARAIGVATGRYSAPELAACDPAAVFEDLCDTRAVVQAIDRLTS